VTGEAQSSPAFRRLPAAIATLLLLAAPPLGAQQRAARAVAPAQAAPVPAATPSITASDRVETTATVELHARPDTGASTGTLAERTSARVVTRSGDWVRVQVEGWVRADELVPATGAQRGVSAAELRADPERYVGQTVEWRLQLIGVQVADELRPEMPPGQPYLLTRGPMPEPGFVYVTVPRAEVARFKALPPLAEILMRVTIKASRTRFLATPVVEFVAAVEPDR
jgi:hypothetical protein